MGSVDRAAWHYESAEQGFRGVHSVTGDLTPAQRSRVRAGKLTGPEYLLQYCDGKLWWSNICQALHPFVQACYAHKTGESLEDYAACCLPDFQSCYNVITTEEGYQRRKTNIDERYEAYRRLNTK